MCWWEYHIFFLLATPSPTPALLLKPPQHPSSVAGSLPYRAVGGNTSEWWSQGLVYAAVAPRRERSSSRGQISAYGSSLLDIWKPPWLVLVTVYDNQRYLRHLQMSPGAESYQLRTTDQQQHDLGLGLGLPAHAQPTSLQSAQVLCQPTAAMVYLAHQLFLLCSMRPKWTGQCSAWLEVSIGSGRAGTLWRLLLLPSSSVKFHLIQVTTWILVSLALDLAR